MATDWTMIYEKLNEICEPDDLVSAVVEADVQEMCDISELARFAEALSEPEITTFSIG